MAGLPTPFGRPRQAWLVFTGSVMTLLVTAIPAAADCHLDSYGELHCDVYNEGDFRAAAQSRSATVTLHTKLTLNAPVAINGGYFGLILNGFNLTGTIRGSGVLSVDGFVGSRTSRLTLTAPPPDALRFYMYAGVLQASGGVGALACVCFGTTLQALAQLTVRSIYMGEPDYSWSGDQIVDTNGFTVTFGSLGGKYFRLVKVGAGTLILTGPTYPSLQTLVKGGVLQVSSDASLGHIYPTEVLYPSLTLDGGTLQAGASFGLNRSVLLDSHGGTFDTNGFTLTVGALNGSGALTKLGSGTLVLNGPSTYTGATTVNAGTLRIAAPGALPNGTALTMAEGSTIDASGQSLVLGSLDGSGSLLIDQGSVAVGTDNTSTLFAGSISGSGSLTKTGTGTLTLTGSNTYSGGTVVNSGALTGTTASLQGTITNNSLLGFSQNDDGAFAGAINGTGSVVKAGSGTVTFATPQLYTGLTEVAAGRLNVTGLAGSALVDPGATLSGTGTIAGSVTVNGMFTTSPASANPALTIGGNLMLGPTATYVFQVANAHTNLLQVNGDTTINGAQLTLAGVNSTLPRVTTLPLLSSIGGISGQFGAVNASVPLDAVVTSRGSTAFAILERTDVSFASLATNVNGHAAGGALDAARATASADLRSVIREVGALSDADIHTALAQLGGSTSAIALRTGALDAQGVLRSVSDRIIDLRTGVRSDLVASPLSARPRRTGVWFRATVSGLSGDAIRSDALSRGGLLGIDREFAEGRWLVGAFGGYDRAALTLDAGANALRDRRYRAGVYAATTLGTAYINAALAGADHRVETTRHLAFVAELDPQFGGGPLFGGIDRSTAARYAGHDVTTFVESGLSRTLGTALVQPFAGLDASHVSTNGFAEHGAGSVDLVASDASTTSVRAAVGIRATRSFAALSGTFAPRVEVRYLHELRDRAASVPVAVAGAPMNGFSVTSPTNGSHAVAASAGFVVEASRRLLFSMDYRGVFAAAVHTQAVTLGVAF
jgi:fibronectin-binding autotransporter adhesin